MTWATVIADASHCPKTLSGGWAAWVRIDGVPHPIKGAGPLRTKVSNSTEAELQAVLNGIWLAVRHGAANVLVRTDCAAVVNVLNGKGKNSRLRDMWLSAMQRPDMKLQVLKSTHVKGHQNNVDAASYVNNWCDQQARMNMRKVRKTMI